MHELEELNMNKRSWQLILAVVRLHRFGKKGMPWLSSPYYHLKQRP